jgi:hypothetical protein
MIQVPLTREQFETNAKSLAAKHGINFPGDEGTIEKMGVKAGYVYADGVLTITILDKPFFLSVDMVEKQLRAFF